ncbi:MAG: hypothetical protein Q4G66_07660 [bacterium]|nr:hypothetical protein [bacterium]
MTIKRDAYRFKDGVTDLSADTFNQIFADLDARLHSLEQLGVTWKDAVSELQQFGLARINGALAPILEDMVGSVELLKAERVSFVEWWESVKEEVQNIHAASVAMQAALVEITARVDGFEAALTAGLASKADNGWVEEQFTAKADKVTVAAQLAERPHKNLIVNGDFSVHHSVLTQVSSGYGSDVCWLNEHVGSSKTHSLELFPIGQAEIPGYPKYFSRTVVNSVAGANNYVRKSQRIESVRTLSGYSGPVSFWARADSPKAIAIEFSQNFGTGGSPSAEQHGISSQLIHLDAGWQLIVAHVEIPSIAGKRLGTNDDDYLGFSIWFDAGSAFSTRASSLGNQSGVFDLADVQIDNLPYVSRFERVDRQLMTAACARYYQFIDNVQGGSGFKYINSSNGYLDAFTLNFIPMRAKPSVLYELYTAENCSAIEPVATKDMIVIRVSSSAAGTYRIYGGRMYLNAYL